MKNLSLVIGLSVVIAVAIQTQDAHAVKNQCRKFKDLDYEFFGTKTLYEDALKHLKHLKGESLPKSFDGNSLEEEHKELVEDSCKPVAFYFIGRHAARFPDAEEIEEYNRRLAELKDELRNQSSSCPDKFKEIMEWRSKMESKNDNLITSIGAKEERDIARRFKKLYPEFFDASKSDIDLGVTSRLRTAQTAAEFLKEVKGMDLPHQCGEYSLPTHNVDEPEYDVDKIIQSECYKELTDRYTKPILEFHKDCDRFRRKQKIAYPMIERVKDPKVLEPIAERVSRRIGLPKGEQISAEVLKNIFAMCKYENAIKDDSVWCDLLDDDDIKAMEYIDDVKTYFKGSHGPHAYPKQSCPLIRDLLLQFQQATKITDADKEKLKSYLYFSHSEALNKLLGALEVFKDDKSYSEERIRDFEDDLKVPEKREWRSSLVSPFSANMAFILYRCAESGKPVEHKILSTVTERPVKLGGCEDTDCSSKKFFDAYASMRNCDLESICSGH